MVEYLKIKSKGDVASIYITIESELVIVTYVRMLLDFVPYLLVIEDHVKIGSIMPTM